MSSRIKTRLYVKKELVTWTIDKDLYGKSCLKSDTEERKLSVIFQGSHQTEQCSKQ